MRGLRLLPPILVALITSLLAQSTPAAKNDSSLISPNSSVSGAKLLSPTTFGSTSSTAKSATGLSSLPADAQGPISARLGKDDPGYWVHRSAEGFHGENPRQALVAEFAQQGAEVHSHNLFWGLEARGYGYGDALYPVKAVAPQANANRVEYRRDGLTEWYENGPLGLEQGFTLAHRPGKANGQALTVELGLRGDLVAALQPGGTVLELKGKDGKAVLRYAGLQARDATGRELRSWLEVRGERLLVRVEDKGARYPVVVDPWIQQAELTASDGQDSAELGASVAVSGSTAVVGSPYLTVGSNATQGAAYVFVESGGTWSQQAKLTASDGAAQDWFGNSVAVSGSTIVVGALQHQVGSNTQQGAAYVFKQSGTTWSQQAELTSSDGAAFDQFGTSVAVDGSTALAGAPCHPASDGSCGPGAAYVFVKSGTNWSQQAELASSDGATFDFFGSSVAVSGNMTAVGAPYHQVGSNREQGAVYVFVQGGTTWSQQAELTSSDGGGDDNLGDSVALSGGTVVAGAPLHAIGSHPWQGAAYVFVQSGTTWSEQAELTAPDGGAIDQFGNSVSVDGGTAVVGSYNHIVDSNVGQGAAYLYVQSGTSWSQQEELIAFDGAPYDYFGRSVAVDGSTIVVGAMCQPAASGQSCGPGAAYVFGSSGPLYTLSAAPSSLTVLQGGQGTSTITITPWNGFSGSVSFSASGLPGGVTAAFSPDPATSASTLTLTANGTATAGTATVLVIGTSGNLTQITPLTLTVILAPAVKLSTTSMGFGNVAVNSTSVAKSVRVKNTGNATLDISNIAPSADFSVASTTCGATLAVRKACQVSVTFTPTELGTVTGTLSFIDNAGNSPQTVQLSGTGVAQATLSPAGYTFPKTKAGNTSAAHNFNLKNNLPTTLTGISYSTAAPFAISTTTCGTALNSKESCTISVTFSPTQTGTATGTLTVSDSANNSPQTARLSGTGD
jgi:hypothetical protein